MDSLESSLGAAATAQLLSMSDRKQMDARLRELGVAKLGQRAALINTLLQQQLERRTLPAPAVPDRKQPPHAASTSGAEPPGGPRAPQVLFIAHSGYFAGHTFGGATRASLAMLRDARRVCGEALQVVCLAQRPMPERMAFQLGTQRLGSHMWEGIPILIGGERQLSAVLEGRRYHAVVSLSIEASLLKLAASVNALRRYAMAHNYYLPPFGPFRRFAVATGHLQLLQQMDALLCPCEHHCAYLRRWAQFEISCFPLYAADYQYFHTRRADGSLALPAAMRPWEAAHEYVTLVSPSPEKGLAVLLTLARMLPDVRFAAVATQWTEEGTRRKLRGVANIAVLEAEADVNVIFRQTKLLLAPSVWQECCPLVVMEAVVRGIPCVSSDWGGLPEANPNPTLRVRATLAYDHARGVLHHGLTNEELEEALAKAPMRDDEAPEPTARLKAVALAVDEEATEDEARPFADLVRWLLDDEAALRRESERSRRSFVEFATRRQGEFARMLQSLAATDVGHEGGGVHERARRAGFDLVQLVEEDLRRDALATEAIVRERMEAIDPPAAFQVVHKPMVYLRAAPSLEAEIVGAALAGMLILMDAQLDGWVRTADPVSKTGRHAWGLVDGAGIGLGCLLKRAS
ncbi:hypothetical protein AB1Y20_020423 [Prymnesium parvum]|uniref:SAP domain-containing protein n=1 Tax=Prymnesium parvum TaxID=97485 RepID=A0AB34JTK5_PRYPA